MRFFFCEIIARLIAIYFFFDIGRRLWDGLVGRQIAFRGHGDIIADLLLDRVNLVVHRDAAPIRYWIQISIATLGLLACLVIAIFGWWHPRAVQRSIPYP